LGYSKEVLEVRPLGELVVTQDAAEKLEDGGDSESQRFIKGLGKQFAGRVWVL